MLVFFFGTWELKDGDLGKGLNVYNTGDMLVWSAVNWWHIVLNSIKASRANVYNKCDRKYLHKTGNLLRFVEKQFQMKICFSSEIFCSETMLQYETKPAVLTCFNCSWCNSDTWLLWGINKHLHKIVTFWMSASPCSVCEVIYYRIETRKSIDRLPYEQRDA